MLALVFPFGLPAFEAAGPALPPEYQSFHKALSALVPHATSRFNACGSQEVFELPSDFRDAVEQLAGRHLAMLRSTSDVERDFARQFSFWA